MKKIKILERLKYFWILWILGTIIPTIMYALELKVLTGIEIFTVIFPIIFNPIAFFVGWALQIYSYYNVSQVLIIFSICQVVTVLIYDWILRKIF